MRRADKTLATCHATVTREELWHQPRGGDRIMSIYYPTSSQCYWNVNYISKFVQPVPNSNRTKLLFLWKGGCFSYNSVETLCVGWDEYQSSRYKVWQEDEVGSLLLSKLKIYKIETKNWQDKEDEIKQIAFAALKLIIKVRLKQVPKTSSKEKSLRAVVFYGFLDLTYFVDDLCLCQNRYLRKINILEIFKPNIIIFCKIIFSVSPADHLVLAVSFVTLN